IRRSFPWRGRRPKPCRSHLILAGSLFQQGRPARPAKSVRATCCPQWGTETVSGPSASHLSQQQRPIRSTRFSKFFAGSLSAARKEPDRKLKIEMLKRGRRSSASTRFYHVFFKVDCFNRIFSGKFE